MYDVIRLFDGLITEQIPVTQIIPKRVIEAWLRLEVHLRGHDLGFGWCRVDKAWIWIV